MLVAWTLCIFFIIIISFISYTVEIVYFIKVSRLRRVQRDFMYIVMYASLYIMMFI